MKQLKCHPDHPARRYLREAIEEFDRSPTTEVYARHHAKLEWYVSFHPSRRHLLEDFAEACLVRLVG